MAEREGAMARVESSVREILDSLSPDDPEKRLVGRVLARVKSDIRLSDTFNVLKERNGPLGISEFSSPPTPEQLAKLGELTPDELMSVYMAQAHGIWCLMNELEGVPRDESRALHEKVMEGLETLGLIGKVSDAKSREARE